MERLREMPYRLIDEPLSRLAHVVPTEHRLRVVAVHHVADPDLDAAIPEGLATSVDLSGVKGGDGVIESHCIKLLSPK